MAARFSLVKYYTLPRPGKARKEMSVKRSDKVNRRTSHESKEKTCEQCSKSLLFHYKTRGYSAAISACEKTGQWQQEQRVRREGLLKMMDIA